MIEKLDLVVIKAINNSKNSFLDRLMISATKLGDNAIIWLFFALILIVNRKYYITGIQLLESILVGSIICNIILKPIFERKRPYNKYSQLKTPIPMKDYSFPSGHTVASFSSMVILSQISLTVSIASLVLALLISISRMYLNVHYFTDVLCGAIIGITVSSLIILF